MNLIMLREYNLLIYIYTVYLNSNIFLAEILAKETDIELLIWTHLRILVIIIFYLIRLVFLTPYE